MDETSSLPALRTPSRADATYHCPADPKPRPNHIPLWELVWYPPGLEEFEGGRELGWRWHRVGYLTSSRPSMAVSWTCVCFQTSSLQTRKLSYISTSDLLWIVFLAWGKTEIEPLIQLFGTLCYLPGWRGALFLTERPPLSWFCRLFWNAACYWAELCLRYHLLVQIWPQEDQESDRLLFSHVGSFLLLCSCFSLKV